MNFKKLVTSVIMVSMVGSITLSSIVNAASSTGVNVAKAEDVLTQFGYEPSIVASMSTEDKVSISSSIVESADSVQMRKAYLVVDNLALFEYYTNTSDKELLKNNESPSNIEKIRNSLKKLNSLSEQDLVTKYSVSSAEYKLLKKALTKNPNYRFKNFGDKQVSTSGTLDTSWMSYSMTVVNKSTLSAPSYDVTANYNWLKTYFCDIYNDKIPLAWGGGLNVKNISSTANYYNGNYYTSWGSFYTTSSWSYSQTPNAGITFSTPQSKFRNPPFNETENKSGTVKATIYQTRYQGYDTNVISEFCHQEGSLSPSISIGVGTAYASISVGTSYSSTPQPYCTIRY